MSFLETIMAGLVVVAIGGLTTFAIREPKKYERLGPWALGATCFVTMLVWTFRMGGDAVRSATSPFVADGKFLQVQQAAEAVQPDIIWILVAPILTVLFLLLLWVLPQIFGPDDDRGKD